ncbi:hypothetical protein [Crossiella cryophila]|uniref:Uncharacterized protein n=1 Tax=Crossiella cryophila TaxID=43355 RepID=A0A7W7C705_9PSEU|nr:hypothetical protein [Crossiella cryophila]MBB4675632.1 hypothetical protein [Crossiella cryophila]
MRIGVRLGVNRAHGALAHEGQVLATAANTVAGRGGRQLSGLLKQLAASSPSIVDSVTWDVSALFERALRRNSGVQPVGAIRVLPRAPRHRGHPFELVRALIAWEAVVTGGHDIFGAEMAALDLDGALKQVETAYAQGIRTLTVTATGASGCAEHEQAIAGRVAEEFPDLRVCLSHEVGGLGLVEREATNVVNAALLDFCEDLVDRCERITATLDGPPSCWFATGDGGRVSARRLRSVPARGLAATAAAALRGAALLSGRTDGPIVLTGPRELLVGEVRAGLPRVEGDLLGGLGVRLVAPQAVLSTRPAATADAVAAQLREQEGAGAVGVLDEGGEDLAEHLHRKTRPVLAMVRTPADLCAVGAAVSEPSAWLDLVVTADTAEDLQRRQSMLERQALSLVAASGARPGRERVIRSVATSLAFLGRDAYRLWVYVGSRPEPEQRT